MEIEAQAVKKALVEAFESGSNNPMDCCDEVIDRICQKFGVRDEEWNYKLWTVEELRKMPLRSTFHHAIMGRCWISEHSGGEKFMRFDKHGQSEFRSDSSPWDVEMRLLYKPPY